MSNSYKLSALAGKIIAIDGPAGSGKSTTAKKLAERLGFIYLDTGAMYRAIAYFALKQNIDLDNEQKLSNITEKVSIEFEMVEGVNRVYINGEDVTESIRTPEINTAVSPVSAHAKVRQALVKRQQEIGVKGNVVAEGRDTTSVVFPKADLKVYLDASLEERARRRVFEYTHSSQTTTLEEQKQLLAKRDKIDSTRANSPLTKTKDSVLIDTTKLNIEEQVNKIFTIMMSRLK